MIRGHGGNIHETARRLGIRAEDITDMSSNMNPLGPPEGLMEHITKKLDRIRSLPQADASMLIEAFAEYHGMEPENVLSGNGTTQFIYMIPKAFEARDALVLCPTYSDYADSCAMNKTAFKRLVADEKNGFVHDSDDILKKAGDYDLVFICNPNNPTGKLLLKTELERLFSAHPNTLFVIDESYMPFVPVSKRFSVSKAPHENVLVLHSMSKIFRIPGLRIGFITGPVKLIKKLSFFMTPWSVNSLAQEAMLFILSKKKETEDFIDESSDFLDEERKKLYTRLAGNRLIKPYASSTSFVLMRLSPPLTAGFLCNSMLENRILVRNCENFYGLGPQFVRVSLKKEKTNQDLADLLYRIASGPLE